MGNYCLVGAVSISDDGKVLKVDSGDGLDNIVSIFNAT